MNRRHFLTGTSAMGLGLALGTSTQLMAASSNKLTKASIAKKRLLILGGTGFIGPPMVRYALERGHEVTIFTRGKSKTKIAGVEHLIGDRTGDLKALEGRKWDVVLDNNARDYRWVKLTTDLLKDEVGHYLFVSSISAYANERFGYDNVDIKYTGSPFSTKSKLAKIPDDFVEGQELPYSETKVMSERLAQSAFPGRATIVRPGFIVGPGDPTDRFTYWPVRIEKGGEVLAPGDGSDPVQFIDVRDLVEWIVRLAENEDYGVYNGVGLASLPSMAEMLYGIRAATTRPVTFTWVPIPFLRKHDVQPYTDMPIWLPGDPLSAVDNSLAIASGLSFRPLAETVSDTLAWHKTRPAQQQAELKIGIKSG
ncbi:MAG: NAD-dependent epimerase/dehydratase family protein, partial [Proteobacteria bacterium]|nr:NAD-dependent epimerase/dehydratase family protein [Pseudomonadota bacterium]